jgi:glycosyltransferase involved in cell wall biosynthesis
MRALGRKIRVLFAIGEMSGGGSQRQLIGILQRLDRARFEPQLDVISSVGELLGEVPADVPVHFFDKSPQPARWIYPGQAFRARAAHLAEVLARERIDVIYDRTYHMTMIAAAAGRRRPTRRISVVVTDPVRDFETNPERFKWLKRRLLQSAYRSADRVVGVSRGVTQAAIDRFGLDPANTVTLYNFFDIEQIDRQQIEPLPVSQQKTPGTFEIVASGRLHVQKGFSFLLRAVADLVQRRGRQQVQLRILGQGPLEAELQDTIRHERIEEHVTLAGFQQNPLPFYRQADLFCLSSLYEGLPNALVEAMLCRAPVLAADCPSGPREILSEEGLGQLVPPADAKALADAIENAIDHHPEWKSRVERSRSHIESHFSPIAGIARLEAMLEDLARVK